MFKFNLEDFVKINGNETGVIIGRAEYNYCDNQYLVRYVNGAGNTTEVWWTEKAITEV